MFQLTLFPGKHVARDDVVAGVTHSDPDTAVLVGCGLSDVPTSMARVSLKTRLVGRLRVEIELSQKAIGLSYC
jgi:hypothetical protein